MANVFAGIDVGKDVLVLEILDAVSEWPNTPGGCRKLVKKIARIPGIHAVCESTGGYEKVFAQCCHEAGVPVSVVFPKRVRDFANACGQWAKSDPIDATMIRRFAEATNPEAQQPPSQAEQELQELVTRRLQIIEESQRLRQRVAMLRHLALRREAGLTLKRLERELAAIEAMLMEVAESPQYQDRIEAMTTVKGIGLTSALTLLAYLAELGTVSRRAVTKLVGLAPFNKDSGQHKGKRSIYGGRGSARKALYMPAMSAIRYNPKLREFYNRLIANGKPKMVALTAVMRKLLIILNAVLKDLTNPAPTP